MYNLKILSAILIVIIGNILFTGCNHYNKNKNNENDSSNNNYEVLSIYEYNDIFSTSYKKYIDPIYKEEYDDLELFLLKQGYKSNYEYVSEYKKLLEISKRHLTSFKSYMKNLVIEDINVTNLNNKLVQANEALIDEIKFEVDKIDNIPVDNYSIPRPKFIDYLEKNINTSKDIENEFENSIKDIRSYLDVELNK